MRGVGVVSWLASISAVRLLHYLDNAVLFSFFMSNIAELSRVFFIALLFIYHNAETVQQRRKFKVGPQLTGNSSLNLICAVR